MTKPPEILNDETGKWARRDHWVAECAEDFGEPEERVDERVDEMLEDGPLNSKEVDGWEYIALSSRTAGMAFIARIKGEQALDGAKRFLGGGDRD